jgi:membrane-associated protease RseP (regulator of RpoE activity)
MDDSRHAPDPGAPSAPSETQARLPGRPRYGVHLVLFLLTCLTTTWVGVLNSHESVGALSVAQVLARWTDGLPYSASIMSILLAHEMGHFVLARWHGVAATLPYFIPVPLPLIGTMGAVIKMEGTVKNRTGLVDIGAAGPLAGLLVAIPVLAYGIHLSPVKPEPPVELGARLLEGNSLLYLSLKYVIKGRILPGDGLDVFLHPVAWAGWVGLLVTMINLMPVGQLDGGHIAFAYFGDSYQRVSKGLHSGLPPLAVLASGYAVLKLSHRTAFPGALSLGWMAGMPWLVWWLMLHLLKRASGGRYHPPVGPELLSRGRRWICAGMIVVFVLILAPVPLRMTL